MNVFVRAKRGDGTRRRGQDPPNPAEGHPGAPGTPPPPQRTALDDTRKHGPRLIGDEAVYSCHCGLVFEAPVTTSVQCPHCGGTQAW